VARARARRARENKKHVYAAAGIVFISFHAIAERKCNKQGDYRNGSVCVSMKAQGVINMEAFYVMRENYKDECFRAPQQHKPHRKLVLVLSLSRSRRK
jgi:hypothetical protein